MIVPSIDLQSGHAVQLVQGERKAIDAGDPRPIAQRFGMVGEIAVIDLDAAMGEGAEGSNAAVIKDLLALAPCRVGGGIRDVDTAMRWLDAGARKVILGSAAKPEILSQLPRERTIAAVDCRDGEVVTHGWKQRTGRRVEDVLAELRPHVGGFLVTFVETEGTLSGLNLDRAKAVAEVVCAGDAPCSLTVAGGVRDASEVGVLDALGIDAQIGMALYSGRFTLADALAACLTSDRPDGLWPTVVCDERGVALGLAYSNRESLAIALDERRGVYWSRKRGLWRKGETSGQAQELLRVDLDCDRDTLRFITRPVARMSPSEGSFVAASKQPTPPASSDVSSVPWGDSRSSGAATNEAEAASFVPPEAFCHLGTRTCWGDDKGWGGLARLARRIASGAPFADPESYTARLLREPGLLADKLREECDELLDAGTPRHAAEEAADLLYFALVRMHQAGVHLEDAERVLDRRELKVKRRPGDAKRARGAKPPGA